MFPSFELFGKTIGLYPLLSLAGLLLAGFIASRAAKKRGLDDNAMLMMLLSICGGLLVGSHLLYAITNARFIAELFRSRFQVITSFARFIDVISFIFGGSVFYGGLIGGMLAAALYARKAKVDFGAYSDAIAPSVPLFHVFGRIGCFFGGCCYGVECSFGFTFTRSPSEIANGVSRFPIQLAEAAFNLVIFIVLAYLQKNNRLKSRIFLLYLIIYPVGRFILEFWRGDEIRGFVFGLSTSQFISILLVIFASVMLLVRARADKTGGKADRSDIHEA